MAREMRERQERRGSLTAAVALAINLVGLVIANIYPLWLPWLHGVVTEDFPRVLWAMNIAFSVQIVGNGVLVVHHPRWLWRVADLLFAVASVLSVAVIYTVFPFDWSAVGYAWMDVLARIALLLALVGVSIAVVVDLVRVVFLGAPVDRTGTSA